MTTHVLPTSFMRALVRHSYDSAALAAEFASKMPSNLVFDVLGRLESVGFFKFVPSEELELVKTEVARSFQLGTLEGEWDQNLFSSTRRSYPADISQIIKGGPEPVIWATSTVLEIEKAHITSVASNVERSVEGKALRLNCVVNDETFLISEFSRPDYQKQCESTIVMMLNKILHNVGSNERFWGSGRGNEFRVILLTTVQCQLISSFTSLDDEWMPRDVG